MSPLEYLGGALDDWPLYVVLLLTSLALHWVVLLRTRTFGLFDPLFFVLLGCAFGWAIVWFMYLRSDIATAYVVSFTLAQLAFYAGLIIGRPRRPSVATVQSSRHDAAMSKALLVVATAVHLGATLAIWSLAGIPLFRASRLGAFQGSGGLGVLERLADSSSLILIFALVYVLIKHRHLRRSVSVHLVLWWYVASTAMSGSKGALLIVGQCILSILFVYTGLRYRKDRFWGGPAGKVGLVLAAAFAIGVLTVQQESDLTSSALALIYRLVSYGDVYIFAYPDASIETLKGDNFLVGLFGGFLSIFRLFPQELVYPNLGYQLTGIVFPDLDLLVGPNPQHPVFGYHYFGWFAFVFSFALGLATVRAQAWLYLRSHTTFYSGFLAFCVYFTVVGISVDFEYTLSRLASMAIGWAVMVAPVLFMFPHATRAGRSRRSAVAGRSA